jgi:endogenous inhibitor of DNA gyrase (YacG/DUF329 family)
MTRESLLTHTRGPGKRKTWEQQDSKVRCARKGCRKFASNVAVANEDPPFCSRACAVGVPVCCPTCGKPLPDERRKGGFKYCDDACRDLGQGGYAATANSTGSDVAELEDEAEPDDAELIEAE